MRSEATKRMIEEVKELVRGALEATKQEISHLEELLGKSDRGTETKGKEFYAQ